MCAIIQCPHQLWQRLWRACICCDKQPDGCHQAGETRREWLLQCVIMTQVTADGARWHLDLAGQRWLGHVALLPCWLTGTLATCQGCIFTHFWPITPGLQLIIYTCRCNWLGQLKAAILGSHCSWIHTCSNVQVSECIYRGNLTVRKKPCCV